VFTQQYGWVWMPYGDQYVYSPEGAVGAAYPSAYVYRPVYGWTWLAAPWVWGVGPRIYFSVGPRYYGWYGHRFGHRGYARPVIRGYGGYRGGYVRGGYGGYRGYGGRGHVIIRGHGGHRR
jgi:hypothetical protein